MASTSCVGLFSELPDDILHKILCYLNLKQRATSSLVCCSWRRIISSFVDSKTLICTSRYCSNCYFSVVLVNHACSCRYCHCHHLRAVIKLAADDPNSFMEFYLIVHRYSFNLSPAIFKLRLLTVLHLQGCVFDEQNLGDDVEDLPLLEEIYFDQVSISSSTFSTLINKGKRLESLFLRLCKRLDEIELWSHKMENLRLSNMVDLEYASIFAPNVRSFKLIDAINIPTSRLVDGSWNVPRLPPSRPVVGSRLMEVEIGFNVNAINRLFDLKDFAQYLGENINLSLKTNAEVSEEVRFHSGNFGSNIQPLLMKHINLEILYSWVPNYKFLIDGLFSYFRPKTLLVKVNPKALRYNFIQVLLDELKGREKCGKWHKCINRMRWHYSLKCFKILELTTTRGSHGFDGLEFQW